MGLPESQLELLAQEFGEAYEEIIELEYQCTLEEFVEDIFPELMGETIEEYIANENNIRGGN